uniref:hypothetical protein n=1 Tax=uncultured Treponema sp. TaxID=162155 RepID=UPI0025F29CFF
EFSMAFFYPKLRTLLYTIAACKQHLPLTVKTKIPFYAEASFSEFSSEEDSKELSVTTLTFEKAVDSISFLYQRKSCMPL